MDDRVEVKFGGNVAEFESAGGQVEGVLSTITSSVRGLVGLFLELGGAATGSFREMRAGAAEAAAGVKETAEGIKEMREAIVGFGEVLIAAFAVEQIKEFAEKMGESAEQTQHTAQTFGLATSDVQALKAEAAGAGVPFEAITTAMQRSDRALTTAREGSKQAGEAFKVLGINIHEPIGQMDLLQRELAGLRNIEDTPTRIGIAMQVFGRNIQAIAPLIGLTKEQLADLNQEIADYGIRNDDAQQKGLALAEAFNTNKIAMQGLGNVLTEALAPAFTLIVQGVNEMIKGFIQSYNDGGAVRVVLDTLVISVKLLAAAASLIGSAFVIAFDIVKGAIAGFSSAWKAVYDYLLNTGKQVADEFITLGKVIYDSLTNNVLQAAIDMKTGWATMAADSKKTADDFAADWAAAGKAASASVNEAMDAMRGSAAFVAGLFPKKNDYWDALHQDTKPLDSGAPPDIHTGGGGSKSKMAEYENDLRQQEFDIRDNTKAWLADMSAMELKFWTDKLATVAKNSKDYEQVLARMQEARLKVEQSAARELLDTDKEKITADKGNVAALAADWQNYITDVTKEYRAGSAQVIAAQAEMTAGMRAAYKELTDSEIRSIDQSLAARERGINDDLELTKAGVEREIGALKLRYDLGQIGATEYAAELERLHQKETDSAVAAAQAQIAAIKAAYDTQMSLAGLTFDQAIAANDKYTAAVGKAWDALNKIVSDGLTTEANDQTAAMTRFKQQWDQTVGQMTQSFARGILQMAQGAKSFGDVMRGIGQQMLEMWVDHVAKMVSDWAAGMAAQVLTHAVAQNTITIVHATAAKERGAIDMLSSLKSIANSAAEAGAAAFKAFAGNPFTLPFAPVAAAAAFAAVIAFKGLVSAAGGMDIPTGSNPMAQLHAEEMVLPAGIANPLRNMLASGGAGNVPGMPWGGGGAGGGFSAPQLTIGGHTIHVDARGQDSPRDIGQAVLEAISGSPYEIAEAVAHALRTGWRPNYRQPFGVL